MSKSPKFLASRHLAARMQLNINHIVLAEDGSFIRRRPLKQKRLRKIDVLAMLILERLEEHLPDIEERSLKDMMADRRYACVLDRMQLRIDLLGHYIQSEWPSLLKRYEADAPLQSTADTTHA